MAEGSAALGFMFDDNSGSIADDFLDADGSVADEASRKRLKRSRSGKYTLPNDERIDSVTRTSQPRYVLHHQVHCDQRFADGHNHEGHPRIATFLDVPRLFAHDNRAAHLRGREQVDDPNIYQHQHADVCVIVYQRYSCHKYHKAIHDSFTKYPIPSDVKTMGPHDVRPWFFVLQQDGPQATTTSEYIAISSENLQRAMKALTKLMPRTFSDWGLRENLESPYSFFYHYVRDIRDFAQQLPLHDQRLVTVLLDYIIESQKEDFGEADRMFERGYVSRGHFGKVFKIDDIVLQNTTAGVRAYQVESIEDVGDDEIEITCVTWNFDGRFYETKQSITLKRPASDKEEHPLHGMKVWPLRLDNPEVADYLRRRGEMFWSLRSRRLVHYKAPASRTFEIRISNPKYMVDMTAYKDLHHQDTREIDPDRTYLDSGEMCRAEPPTDPFVLLLPAEVIGFGFHDKKWRTLHVANMKPVEWNRKAFKHGLVLQHSKKELIEALVKVHLGTAAPSDVIEDKGAGLIMLLHGPPGTGKTLTAESVAELAEKPLYRITCGDMGTDPESVEKYLESALYIGTMWSCVVLLDEADVFLEEQTQTDLIRNALVSVFLRVLEYYDGILILTSNRVGMFDEAFKSRMQLAVYYPTLTDIERRSIWRAFFKSLYDSKVILDKEELDREVERLAVHNFNGRQIRNVIKTARQLAIHRNRTGLHAKDLDDVIEVANDFDTYITNARGHTDEQWAIESRTRAKEIGSKWARG